MPSGKQLSFRFGEVSPSLQYRSDVVSYAEGLKLLRNGKVRRAGGASNRSGTILAQPHPFQGNLPITTGKKGVYLSRYRSEEDSVDKVVSYATPTGLDRLFHLFSQEGVLKDTNSVRSFNDGYGPSKAKTLQVEEKLNFLFGDRAKFNLLTGQVSVEETASDTLSEIPFSTSMEVPYSASMSALTSTGIAPTDIPVAYIITEVLDNGLERFVVSSDYGGGHPHDKLSASFSVTNITRYPEQSHFNIYRAGNIDSAFGLVGVIRLRDSAATSFTFRDFITVPDYTRTPPFNDILWGPQSPALPNWFNTKTMQDSSAMMMYQQRLFVAYVPTSTIDNGVVGVSALGSPYMLNMPDVNNAVGAFEFKVPIPSKEPIRHLVAAYRPFIFTEQEVIVLNGSGERGVITATEINAVTVSDIGCHKEVAPVRSGEYVYYLSHDSRRLMRIFSGPSGEVKVDEIGVLIDHFLESDINRLEILSSEEETVFALRNDGKLIELTVDDGIVGASLHESGFIEDICKIRTDRKFYKSGNISGFDMEFNGSPVETLIMSVIREDDNPAGNGTYTRYIEVLSPRDDKVEEGFVYSDASTLFGGRLVLTQNGRYAVQLASGIYPYQYLENSPLNIEGGVTWEAGEELTLTSPVELPSIGAAEFVDFFYDDSEGRKRTLRFTVTGSTWTPATPLYEVTGFFSDDVPLELRDASSQGAYNMEALQTRYTIPISQVTGLTHLQNKKVSVFADGMVISSPNSPDVDMEVLEVDAAGVLELQGSYSYGVIGLSYEFQMDTLDIESSDNRTLTDARKTITSIGVALRESRGGYVTQAFEGGENKDLSPLPYGGENDLDAPESNFNGHIKLNISGTWDASGSVIIKQLDPIPLSVLSVYPKGMSGD